MCPHLVHTIGFSDVLVDYIEHLKFRGSKRWQYQKLIGGEGESQRESESERAERERELASRERARASEQREESGGPL